MPEPLEHAYFNWLCAKVNRLENSTPSLRYDLLFRMLHNTEFVWLVVGDDNRAEDGIELRRDFLTVSGYEDDQNWMSVGCSVFEMLIAFSKRAEFATDISFVDWFWEFIENLGLKEFCNANLHSYDQVSDILYTFVWRQYNFSGDGGLFPLRGATHDQTDVEIWYQFCEYLADQDRMP